MLLVPDHVDQIEAVSESVQHQLHDSWIKTEYICLLRTK